MARLRNLIGHHGLMTDGDWVESKDQDPDGDVRLIQLADVGDGKFLDKSNRFLTTQSSERLSCTLLVPRDILVSRLGEPLGKTCLFPLVDRPCITVVDVHVVRPSSDEINRNWLVHSMNSAPIRRVIDAQSSGTTRKRVTGQKLKDLEVRVPPANEQQRIASKIDELFSRIDEGERALERVQKLVERYRQSVLKAAVTGELTREWRAKNAGKIESGEALLARILDARREAWEKTELGKMKAKGVKLVNDKWKQKYDDPMAPDTTDLPELPEGWVWASLDQLCCLITSGSRGWSEYYADFGSLFIRAQNIKHDVLDLSDIAFVDLAGVTEGIRTKVGVHDILVTITGANVTKAARVTADLENAFVSQHVALVRAVFRDVSPYLFNWIVSPANGRAALLAAAYGAGKPGLSLEDLKELVVALPPQMEQEEVCELMDVEFSRINSIAADAVSRMNSVLQLRQAILKCAFAGELVRQNPTDEPASALLERIAARRCDSAPATKRRRARKSKA